ncbi:hypothetical protein BH09PSE4_BH09PSE4_21970 [soil metagenome]
MSGSGGIRVDGWGAVIWAVDVCTREATLFAAVGFLLCGIDDVAVDIVYAARRLLRTTTPASLEDFPLADKPGRIAIFVPAWREEEVIGAMLESALGRIEHPDFRIYVGAYANDRATIAAAARVAARDARVRLVVGETPGPTTKGGNLNRIYRALLEDEAREGVRVKAVVLHDAEDVVHPGELRVFDRLVESHWIVQLPVLPLVDRGGMIAGHYADEFAEAHTKQMVVREALGAALPLAGVGCAIARDALDAVAAVRGDGPFDGGSLTEDYEFGLHAAGLGGRGIFARIAEAPGGRPVAVRAYFPDRLDAAVRQKARWMTGIALAGWDRIGWGRAGAFGDHWMRMRDRRSPLAILLLASAYVALIGYAASRTLHALFAGHGGPGAVGGMAMVLSVNAALLVWRLVMRSAFTYATYGMRQALLSLPRAFVANYVALLAARRAFVQYGAMLLGAKPRWDKTDHIFPDDPDAAIRG